MKLEIKNRKKTENFTKCVEMKHTPEQSMGQIRNQKGK